MSTARYPLLDSSSLPFVETLGKVYLALGKAFADCYTQQKTLGKHFIGKGLLTPFF
jgi:hypothetical protein